MPVSHGVAMGWRRRAPLGRIWVGTPVSHGVAMGCQRHAPLGRIRVGTDQAVRPDHFVLGRPALSAPKVHFTRQPTATLWGTHTPKNPQPYKGFPDRPQKGLYSSMAYPVGPEGMVAVLPQGAPFASTALFPRHLAPFVLH
jgi:hypothetical protein